MSDLIFEHNRHFPSTHMSDDLVLVVPDTMTEYESVLRVQDALTAQGGQMPEIVPQSDFIEEFYQDTHVIACGHLANNTVLQRLYTMRCSFVDTFFPGRDGYFIKSVSDPFGYGKNCIVVGASADQELTQALDVFESIVHKSQGDLTRIHAYRFLHELPPFPDESELEGMIQAQLETWNGGWSASPFRGGGLLQYMWHYYLTDHDGWARAIPPIFAGSLEPWRSERRDHPESYHCFFNLHSVIHLWDLIEDSPLYTDDDRSNVVTMFGELLEHLAGLFYLKPEVNPPGEPRQNHSTFIGLDLAVGHDYMAKRYDIRAFEPTIEAVERIFDGQADSYKPNDDAGVGYAWHVPKETLYYMLYKNDYGYIDNGHVADLCRLAVVTTDNMRSEGGYGDTAGYHAFSPDTWSSHLWPLMVSTWQTRDPRHLWTLNWLGEGKQPSLAQTLPGLYASVSFTGEGFTLEGCTPEEPADLFGICPMRLPGTALRWVHNHTPQPHQPSPDRTYFDKISFRSSFDPQDEYLLLEGVGTFCHGHEDSNTIIRLTWHNRAWLADGDYIRAAPKFHNAVAVSRDGVGTLESPGDGVVIPPLASVNTLMDSPEAGMLQTEAAGYNGVDWRRNIFWKKGRYFVVMDQLSCSATGDYSCRCLWRLVGEVTHDGDRTRLSQQGEQFLIHNADGAQQDVVPDLYEGGEWKAYPYADGPLHVLHQTTRRHMDPGDHIVFANLLTPYEDIRIERLSDRMVKVTDGTNITVFGVDHTAFGATMIESTLFSISLTDEILTVQGIQRIGYPRHGTMVWEDLEGEPQALDLQSSSLARHLKTVMTIQGHRPAPRRYPRLSHPEDGLRPVWSRDIAHTGINDVDVRGALIAAGTVDGQVMLTGIDDGTELWRQQLDQPVSTLLLSDIDADGTPEVLVGTTDSELVVLDGGDGSERWRRELRNISGRGATVSDLAAADLDGTGQSSILAGTAGWYVNAFTADGNPIWANWIRYHPITKLAVADTDRDGRAEVMVGTIYSTPLSVHNFDGSFRWSTLEQVGAEGNATTPRRGIHLTQLRLADVDDDGILEIVYGTADGWIYTVKPQDGAEVWHMNIVGEVTGLVTWPAGIAAAGEFGELYRIGWDGQVQWRVHAANGIHDMVISGDHLFIAADRGTLLCYNLQGICTGSFTAGAEIQGIWACENGVVCNLEGGRLTRIVVSA